MAFRIFPGHAEQWATHLKCAFQIRRGKHLCGCADSTTKTPCGMNVRI